MAKDNQETKRKKFDYNDLSSVLCAGKCGNYLKKNLLLKKPNARFCFICFMAASPTPIRTFRKRNLDGTFKPGGKVVNYRELAKSLRLRVVNEGK